MLLCVQISEFYIMNICWILSNGFSESFVIIILFISFILWIFWIAVTVTECGVWLLAAQKPIKRQGWWKGKFALFWRPTTGGVDGGWRVDSSPKAASPTPTASQGARAFIGGGRGLHVETAQSALTVFLKLVMWWSDQCHLDCFKHN